MPQQTEDNGEEGQGSGNTKTKKSKKKSPHKGSDDETSRKSKRTKSDDEVSVLGGKGLDSSVVNLEAMKGIAEEEGSRQGQVNGRRTKSQEVSNFRRVSKQRSSSKSQKLLFSTTNV